MNASERVWIFAGRFQPFHEGHLMVARGACAAMPRDAALILGAVAPMTGNSEPVSDFSLAAREHQLPERNPWNIATRLAALAEVSMLLSREYPEKLIISTALPRPDISWPILQNWFAGKRTWVIPSAGESFDEIKAEYFRQMGDQVMRFSDSSNIDGRIIRSAFAQDPDTAAALLPEVVRNAFAKGWTHG